MRILRLGAASALALGLWAAPAAAGCHLVDCVEDTYVRQSELRHASCETLWILRNSIFKDAGYCFRTPRAIRWFGNAGCRYDDAAAVPLNPYQSHNVEVIRREEWRKACTPG